MLNKIQFFKFTPTAEMRKYADAVTFKILEDSPSDSNLFLRFIQTLEGVAVGISLASNQLRMSHWAMAPTSFAALDKVVGKVEQQLFEWRAVRQLLR